MIIQAILFDDFETLDLFGPVEALGALMASAAAGSGERRLVSFRFASLTGGTSRSIHGVRVATEPIVDRVALGPGASDNESVSLLIPGGQGTRTQVDNAKLIETLARCAAEADYVMTVCTGAALLARTGLLDGRPATTNKRAFDWVRSQGPAVRWNSRARWVVDGKFYTSSGISAGIDMAFGFARDRFGDEIAREAVRRTEYVWNENAAEDPFGW